MPKSDFRCNLCIQLFPAPLIYPFALLSTIEPSTQPLTYKTYPLKIYSSPNYQPPLLILSSRLQIIFIYHINLHFTKIWRKYLPLLVDAINTCTNTFHSFLPKLPTAAIVLSHSGLHGHCFSNLRPRSPTFQNGAPSLLLSLLTIRSWMNWKLLLHFHFYPKGSPVILLPVPSHLPTLPCSHQSLLQNTLNTFPKTQHLSVMKKNHHMLVIFP